MQRDLWRTHYQHLPKWACPRCGTGKLLPTPGYPAKQETGYSARIQHQEPEWEPDWIVQRFVAILRCDEAQCGEIVTVAGIVPVENVEDYDTQQQDWVEFYMPQHVSPAPHIIHVSPALPRRCTEHLLKSFELFWTDKGAAANRLRIVVERLMDAKGVVTKGKGNKNKVHDLSLAERIDEFEKMTPGHKVSLDALRHVGNYGSHEGEGDEQALLDCYELLEHAFEDLIDNKKANLQAKAQKLIANKGKSTV